MGRTSAGCADWLAPSGSCARARYRGWQPPITARPPSAGLRVLAISRSPVDQGSKLPRIPFVAFWHTDHAVRFRVNVTLTLATNLPEVTRSLVMAGL